MSGLLLLTALQACAHRPADLPGTVPVAVAIERTLPPADLMVCAERPAGLPEDASLIAQIPTTIRAGIIRMARAFRTNADGKDRLINWLAADSCPVPGKAVR